MVAPYSVDNAMVAQTLTQPLSVSDPTGMVVFSNQIDLQATMVGYAKVFHLMFLVTLAMMPVVLVMRTPKENGGTHAPPHEATHME